MTFNLIMPLRHRDKIHVEWNIGKRCNFDCSYCPTEIHDNFSHHSPHLFIAFDKLCKHIDITKARISLTGGEPTVHPRILDLVKHIKEVGTNHISVTTNLSRTIEFYKELMSTINNLVVSYHFEHATDDYIDKILALRNEKSTMHVHLMDHKDYDTAKIANILMENKIPTVVRAIRWQTDQRDEYISDVTATAEYDTSQPNAVLYNNEVFAGMVNGDKLIRDNSNKFEGWSCKAGIESLMIDTKFDVYRATCRVGGKIGNLLGKIQLPDEPIICSRKTCTCAADVILSKEQIK